MASDSQDQLQSPVLLKISFMKDNPLDSDVVNDTTGELLFRISTLSKLLSQKSKTTMYDAHEQVVAEYECGWVHSKVTFRGETKDAAEWLPKVGFWTRSVVKSLLSEAQWVAHARERHQSDPGRGLRQTARNTCGKIEGVLWDSRYSPTSYTASSCR